MGHNRMVTEEIQLQKALEPHAEYFPFFRPHLFSCQP